MEKQEKTNTESKQQNTGSSFPNGKCQGMAEMMKSLCGSDKGSFDCNEMMQSMFGNTAKEGEKP